MGVETNRGDRKRSLLCQWHQDEHDWRLDYSQHCARGMLNANDQFTQGRCRSDVIIKSIFANHVALTRGTSSLGFFIRRWSCLKVPSATRVRINFRLTKNNKCKKYEKRLRWLRVGVVLPVVWEVHSRLWICRAKSHQTSR